ncbi:MAG TPA: MarR family transcriptional regulator [Candidatus Limnocylindrales bacterium]|nr:MarR family transcriptional regulator [Candidatus Limnocylindrales bacterium]
MDRKNVDSVLRSLRRVNIQGSFLGQTVAVRFGLSESDIETLEELIDMGAATAGKLSEVTGLTSGAVTRVIDRLEQAGYVRRVPDPTDRRRVIVEVVPDKVANIQVTLDQVSDASAKEIRDYSDEQLELIADFLSRMESVAREEATALRGSREAAASAGASEYAAPIGGLSQARLLFRSGANELTLRAESGLEDLYRGRFEGPVPVVRVRDGTVIIGYKGFGKPWDWRKRSADLALTTALPWTVDIVGGAHRLTADLRGIDLRGFDVAGGADSLRVAVGQPRGELPIRVVGGGNKVRIERPAGVPARVTVDGGAAGIELDRQRLGSTAGHIVLESNMTKDATDLVAVEVTGGVAKLQVVEAEG